MNITNLDEALEKIDELKKTIDDLQCDLQAKESDYDDVASENGELSAEMSRIQEFDIEKEPFAEKVFNAGYLAGKNGEELLRAWLNHKIEARL